MQLIDHSLVPLSVGKAAGWLSAVIRGLRRTVVIINNVSNSPRIASAPRVDTIFIDRDGVVNEKMPEGQYVRSLADFKLLNGVPEAIARLNQAGLRVVVVTNQSGIAQGLYKAADVLSIHASLRDTLADHGARIDGFYFCPHGKGGGCNCRKPLPGMFEQAQAEFPEIDAATSIMIGDSLPDIEFGHRLGMQTIFIEGNPQRQKPGAEAAAGLAGRRFPSLAKAVEFLLEEQNLTCAV
jgi:D-glycero-D-manno-heptose 1,7-bisphosphate phosphatase